jgi:DNA polymerase-3 subunit beta
VKFTIDREAFVEALFAASVVTKSSATLPVLACCQIDATKDGRIVVQATDLVVWVRREVAADVQKPGRVVVDLKRVFSTVKSSPAGPVECHSLKRALVIDQSRVHAQVNELEQGDFPEEPTYPDAPHRIAVATLLDMFEKTAPFIGRDESQAVFCAAWLHKLLDGSLRMIASDRVRFAQVTLRPQPEESWGNIDALIPREGVAALQRLLCGDGVVGVGVEGDRMLFISGETRIVVQLIHGRYPDCDHIFRHEPIASALVNRDCLTASLKRAAIFAGKSNRIRLTLSDGTLEVFSTDQVSGELVDPVPCVAEQSPPLALYYNYKFVRQVLAVIEGDDVKLDVAGLASPTYVTDSARPEVAYVIMPMDEGKEEADGPDTESD